MKYMDKDFAITSISDEKALYNLNHDRLIENSLNENLSIKEFSSSIEGIVCVFHADKESNSEKLQDYKSHKRKYNIVEIHQILDYNKFTSATKEEAIQMMKEKYLEGINLLNKQKDFNSKKFYSDVKEVFKA